MTVKASENTAKQCQLIQQAQLRAKSVNLKSAQYLGRYTSEIIRGLARNHRPALDRDLKAYSYKVSIDESTVQSWLSFVSNRENPVGTAPLTYYNCAGAFGFFDILKELRINFSTILHLKAELDVIASKPLSAGIEYCLSMFVVDIIPRESNCILVIKSELHDADGELLRTHKDYWFVRKCAKELMKDLSYPGNHDGSEFIGISKKQSRFSDLDAGETKSTLIRVPSDAGQQFAKISGDYNVIHTTNWGARLCGKKKAFLQGFGVMNLCLHHISIILNKPVEHFDITFSKPIYVGQEVAFIATALGFELCDESGELLAFGNFV